MPSYASWIVNNLNAKVKWTNFNAIVSLPYCKKEISTPFKFFKTSQTILVNNYKKQIEENMGSERFFSSNTCLCQQSLNCVALIFIFYKNAIVIGS